MRCIALNSMHDAPLGLLIKVMVDAARLVIPLEVSVVIKQM